MKVEVHCADAKSWFDKIAEFRLAGEELVISDDVRTLNLGFTNTSRNEVYYVGMRTLKRMTEEDVEGLKEFGLSYDQIRSSFATPEGKAILFG